MSYGEITRANPFDQQTMCKPICPVQVRMGYLLIVPTWVCTLVRQMRFHWMSLHECSSEPPCGLDPQSGASSRLMETDAFRKLMPTLSFALLVSRFTFFGFVAAG